MNELTRIATMRKAADATIARIMRGVVLVPFDMQGVYLGLVWRAVRYAVGRPRAEWMSIMSMTANDALDAVAEAKP